MAPGPNGGEGGRGSLGPNGGSGRPPGPNGGGEGSPGPNGGGREEGREGAPWSEFKIWLVRTERGGWSERGRGWLVRTGDGWGWLVRT